MSKNHQECKLLLFSVRTSHAIPLPLLVLIVTLTSLALIVEAQPHLRKRNNNTSSMAASSLFRFPLHENSGTQHVYIWMGQPAVRQTLIVDTGSRFTATTCEGCVDCGVHANPYLPTTGDALSTTRIQHTCDLPVQLEEQQTERQTQQQERQSFSLGCGMADRCFRNACQIVQKYTEGSTWKAVEVNDIVALGEGHLYESTWDAAAAFSFGCQTEVRGLFRKQYADGILGLERTDYSIVETMAKQGILERPSFSLCLHPTGGWLGLGGAQIDRHLHNETPMKFTPIPDASEHAWYSVMVREVWLGNNVLVADERTAPDVIQAFARGKRTILDSGTTDTFLPAALAPYMANAWEKATGLIWKERKREYSYQEFLSLPLIHLVLEANVTLTLQPQYYMEGALPEPWSGIRRLTNRVYTDERTGAVLGLNAMMGYDIYFEGSRVGLAKADCT